MDEHLGVEGDGLLKHESLVKDDVDQNPSWLGAQTRSMRVQPSSKRVRLLCFVTWNVQVDIDWVLVAR
ncbi:hypothetical protein BDR04DRAFT_1109123 [Suillus decipiens]|nr:hypothetical protein BDR04DRAFT_1109123 [Suillus decipiens]